MDNKEFKSIYYAIVIIVVYNKAATKANLYLNVFCVLEDFKIQYEL